AADDALLSAALFALDPIGLGGIFVESHAGRVRSGFFEFIQSRLPPAQPSRKLPLSIQDERLLGGLDLVSTLQSGRPVLSQGLLAEGNGGVLWVAMAERMGPALAARIALAMDRGEIVVAREGLVATTPTVVGLVLFDEQVEEDESAPRSLLDRLAFHIDLRAVPLSDLEEAIHFFQESQDGDTSPPNAAWDRTALPELNDSLAAALCTTALALGIDSLRAVRLAHRVAALACSWRSASQISQEDAAFAARLVLAPRATMLPAPEKSASAQEPPPAEPPQSDSESEQAPKDPQQLQALDEVVLQAAKAAIPAGLLAQLLLDPNRLGRGGSGKSGALKKSGLRGRPIGSQPGLPRSGARLSLMDTLRAAAPWQRLRRCGQMPARSLGRTAGASALQIRAEDFRIRRFKERSETTTIFVVDASGSSALHRLAEAKGAVELLLADCYVRRDQVAVIAFRNQQAEIILPPTRSLVRAKRSLSGLPGGGGTPLAKALQISQWLAESVKRRGGTPVVVMLTDGKANISLEGQPGREQARRDVALAAQQFLVAGVSAMVIDTSPQPSAAAQALSEQMRARYLPLPYAGAAVVSQAVKTMV
ncbi:MAG: magnesium chelatase subunit D, partial [Burkholderiaceae bacterium]